MAETFRPVIQSRPFDLLRTPAESGPPTPSGLLLRPESHASRFLRDDFKGKRPKDLTTMIDAIMNPDLSTLPKTSDGKPYFPIKGEIADVTYGYVPLNYGRQEPFSNPSGRIIRVVEGQKQRNLAIVQFTGFDMDEPQIPHVTHPDGASPTPQQTQEALAITAAVWDQMEWALN